MTRFPRLASALTAHTNLALLYAVGCILLVYAVGMWTSPITLFLIAELPAVIMIAYAVSASEKLRVRVPLLQILTAVFVWTYSTTGSRGGAADISSSVCFLFIVGYFTVRAVAGSLREFRSETDRESVWSAIALLMTAWGATVQVAFAAFTLLKSVMPIGDSSIAGSTVRALLTLSPGRVAVSVVPSGLLALGILMYTAARFRDDPYLPPEYDEIARIEVHPVLDPIVRALCIPLWVAVVVLGFVFQFVKHFWSSLSEFLIHWLGRLILIMASMVVPVAAMTIGHFCLRDAMRLVLEGLPGPLNFASVQGFLLIHGLALLALSMYVVAVAPMVIEIVRASPGEAVDRIRGELNEEGYPASKAVGEAFALYGVVFLAVPTANLLPGTAGFGLFSTIYAAVGIALLSFVAYRALQSRKYSAQYPARWT